MALAIQRVRVTLQNLCLLANKTPGLEAAARDVEAGLPVYSGGQWTGAFFGDAFLDALDAFEEALEAAGPSEVARRIGAWSPRPAPAIAAQMAS